MIILKHDLCTGLNHLFLPDSAEVLIVHEQNNMPRMWTLSKDSEPSAIERRFYLAATGEKLPEIFDKYKPYYLGSIYLFGGSLVYHAFELR